MNILVTSGGTRIQIDRVRHIANMSRGTFGSQIAKSFLELHPQPETLWFFRAEGSKSPFSLNLELTHQSLFQSLKDFTALADLYEDENERYQEMSYKTFENYAEGLEYLCKRVQPEIIILAAAVSDYGTEPLNTKIRSKDSEMEIKLHKLPKLIERVRTWCPKSFLVGFKLLVDSTSEELKGAALDSCIKNDCDMVVANDLRDVQNSNHTLTLVHKDETVQVMSQKELEETVDHPSLARWLVSQILEKNLRRGLK